MENKNIVAAVLACAAMLGFMAILVFLATGKVPAENKDFFNMGLVALIGFVGTAFGYYLGSSQGSAQKNNILAQVASPNQLDLNPVARVGSLGSEAGFIRASLLFFLSILLIIGLLSGCATGTATAKPETPQSIAAKTLLTTRQAIIGAATGIDAACTQGLLKQADCTTAGKVYDQSQAIWPAAADAFLLYLVAGDAISKQKYDDVLLRLNGLFTDLNKISTTFQGVK